MRKLLDGFTPDDVFDAIGGEVPRTALFTSFTFSPAAFNDQYLRELQKRGCERVIVLVDPLGYAQSLDDAAYAEGVGTDYVLRTVKAAGAFHAKLVVVQTPRRTILGVGSGNLTVAGLLANAEVGGLCILESEDSQNAIANTCLELMSLAELNESPGQVMPAILVADDTWFITSVHQPIAEQLSIPGSIEQIVITTPFVDQSKRVMTWLRNKWPGVPVRIRIDPIFENLSAKFISTLDSDTTVHVPVEASDAARGSVHGKLFVWRRGEDAYAMLGSANMTAPALLDRTNVEEVLLRRVSTRDAKHLLQVPGTKWRKVAAADVRASAGSLEPARTTNALVAELRAHNLSLTWESRHASGRLTLLVRGVVVAERELHGITGPRNRVTADVELTSAELAAMSGPRVARLVTVDGTTFEGWVEVRELLDTPPEAKRRLQFLRDLSAGPDNCDEKDVVQFLEWLRRGLQEDHVRRRRSLSAVGEQDDTSELNQSIERSLLLIKDVQLLDGGGWEQIVEASFDSASSSIHFFDAEIRAASRSASSKAAEGRRNTEVIPHRKAAPPATTAILRALFEQLAASLEIAEGAEAVAIRLKQLPMCLKALKFCKARWRISSHEARRYLTPVVVAFLGPGEESVVQQSGVLKRMTQAQCGSLGEFHGVRRAVVYLHGILLTLSHFRELPRVDVVKDMQDLLLAAFPICPTTDFDDLQDELNSVLSDEGTVDFSLSSVQETLEHEEGEVGRLQRQRKALRELVILFQQNAVCE